MIEEELVRKQVDRNGDKVEIRWLQRRPIRDVSMELFSQDVLV